MSKIKITSKKVKVNFILSPKNYPNQIKKNIINFTKHSNILLKKYYNDKK